MECPVDGCEFETSVTWIAERHLRVAHTAADRARVDRPRRATDP